jgi:chromosome segregation ATPase
MAAERVQEEVEGRFGRLESDMAHTRAELADIKLDHRDIRDTLGKMNDSITTLREQTQRDFASLRAEMHQGFASLRADTQSDFAALRDEMHQGFAALRDEMHQFDLKLAKLDHKIDRKSLTDRLWMLSASASLLAVMAHGFKWI